MKNYIVSIILATAAIFAVGLAAYSANGNHETTIHGGKLMAETSIITEAEVEPAPINQRSESFIDVYNQKDYAKINHDSTLLINSVVLHFDQHGDYMEDLAKIRNDLDRWNK